MYNSSRQLMVSCPTFNRKSELSTFSLCSWFSSLIICRSTCLLPEQQVAVTPSVSSPILRTPNETPLKSCHNESSKETAEVEKMLADSPLTNEPLLIRPLGHDVPTPESMASTTSVQAFLGHVTVEEQLNAMIIKDVTVPSGQAFPPGAEFIKTWRVVNSGTAEWPKSTVLVFMGGDAMTSNTRPILVGNVKVGAEVELSTPGLKVGFRFASRMQLTTCATLGTRVDRQLYRLLGASDGGTRSIWRQHVD